MTRIPPAEQLGQLAEQLAMASSHCRTEEDRFPTSPLVPGQTAVN